MYVFIYISVNRKPLTPIDIYINYHASEFSATINQVNIRSTIHTRTHTHMHMCL